MRFLLRLILWLILLSPFALAASAWFALEDMPRVAAQRQLSHQDIARARTIIKRNDPRQLPAGSRQTVRVSQTDLNLAANYLYPFPTNQQTSTLLPSRYPSHRI